MWKDPIVEEVRKAGEELARQANYDLHTFCENLRKNAKKTQRENRFITITAYKNHIAS